MDNQNVQSIASVAYRTGITDRGLLDIILNKIYLNNLAENHVKAQSSDIQNNKQNKINSNTTRRRIPKGTSNVGGRTEKIWQDSQFYTDTSNMWRRPYIHLGLWTRINRNSKSSLPLEIKLLTGDEITSSDSDAITRYLTFTGSIRKCCTTVFTQCSKMAIRSLGCLENSPGYLYSCKPIVLSVQSLAKNTHAGTDTMGRKNDPEVIRRVISQVKDVFRRPTSYKLFKNNVEVFLHSTLSNLFDLPEIIFHRFQATYNKELNKDVEKSRIVWCVPFTIVAIENIFFGNIIEATKIFSKRKNEVIYPIGLTNYEIGHKSVGTLRDTFKRLGKRRHKIYSLDFKKFDSTIPNWVKDIFFSLSSSILNLDENYKKVFDYLRVYIKYTPFIYQNKIHIKRKGISSGLLITNFFDTFWNLTIHFFVKVLKEVYFKQAEDIYLHDYTSINELKFDVSMISDYLLYTEPHVRVMGDDTLILCDEYTLILHKKVCRMLGMEVTVKHVTHDPYDDIFFLGRYWNAENRPFQTEHYIALRITYTKWFDEKKIPFSIEKLHLYRILSICLPLVGGKAFLDKYLFDYEPYKEFHSSKEGFVYMKEFIEENFKYVDYDMAFDVDNF